MRKRPPSRPSTLGVFAACDSTRFDRVPPAAEIGSIMGVTVVKSMNSKAPVASTYCH
jgi:hypothetical protein